MEPGTSVLLQRLQNFLPQIKQANEAVDEQMKGLSSEESEALRIDKDILVEDSDSEDGDSDSDSDSDSDCEGGASGAAAPTQGSHQPAVQIKLAFGQVDDDVLEALGETPGGASSGAASLPKEQEADGDEVTGSSAEEAVLRSLKAPKKQEAAAAVGADSPKEPELMREVSTRKKKA